MVPEMTIFQKIKKTLLIRIKGNQSWESGFAVK